MVNPNILSSRYTTDSINEIFSEQGKNLLEREFWIEIMKVQKILGVSIPLEDIEKFEKSRRNIDLGEIRRIEEKTRHDIKAKIEAFVKVSGAKEHLHKGMTSRDLTDNVEQIQFKRASRIIFGKYVSILRHFLDRSIEYKDLTITARTHHQPAQITTFGRRFSMWAEELFHHLERFEKLIEDYPMRGIKGPVGTALDMTSLLGGSSKVDILEKKVAERFGFKRILNAVGQVYPRSYDYALISCLSQMTSSLESFAKTLRLMCGSELTTEGFKEGQVGSSAMPHKMNTRTSERINGFGVILKGLANTSSFVSGDQWEEGDVSDSVVRRFVMSNAFYASDGICEATLEVLNNMGVYEKIIEAENKKYLPFLSTTQILMEAVKRGIGREEAHEIIKKYSVEDALALRNGAAKSLFLENLSKNEKFVKAGLTINNLREIISDEKKFLGKSGEQINRVIGKARPMLKRYRKEAGYEPGRVI